MGNFCGIGSKPETVPGEAPPGPQPEHKTEEIQSRDIDLGSQLAKKEDDQGADVKAPAETPASTTTTTTTTPSDPKPAETGKAPDPASLAPPAADPSAVDAKKEVQKEVLEEVKKVEEKTPTATK